MLRRVDRERAGRRRALDHRAGPRRCHDERLVVAEYDGEVAGAVHLRAATITPLNLEPVVQAISPHVFPEFRRHGVGRALMEAAVACAEENGIGHVATAVGRRARATPTGSWRGSRSARTRLLRVAPTHAVQRQADRPAARRRPRQRPPARPRCSPPAGRCAAQAPTPLTPLSRERSAASARR